MRKGARLWHAPLPRCPKSIARRLYSETWRARPTRRLLAYLMRARARSNPASVAGETCCAISCGLIYRVLESSLIEMKCKAVLKEIEELDAGASLSALADEHLLACASCRAFADERAALKQLVGSLESVSAPPDFDWRLRARLAEARSERGVRERLFPYFAPGAQAIAIAATIVILLVAAVAYRQIMPLQRSVKESSAIASIKIK